MYDDIVDLAMDQQLLSEMNKGNYNNLPIWKELDNQSEEQIKEYEENHKSQRNFDIIFNEPIGYYFMKVYLELQHSVDKAVFISDVNVYKSTNDSAARLQLAKKIYEHFCEPEKIDRKPGVSCLPKKSFFRNQLKTPENNNNNNKSSNDTKIKTSSKKLDSKGVNDNNNNNKEPKTKITKELIVNTPLKKQRSSILQMSSNAIGIFGKPITEVKKKIDSGIVSQTLFDDITKQIINDLKLDIFPRFCKSYMYKLYLRCKLLESKQITINSFKSMRTLGRGAFGSVNACKKKDVGRLYAMKQIDKRRVQATDSVSSLIAERDFLSEMDGKFVTSLKYAFVDDDRLYLVMDLMTGGDLKYHLNRDGYFDEKRSIYHAAQILLGLEHIHSKGIVYRDLKLENILVDEYGQCKISDLGLAVRLSDGPIRGYAGTPGYTAPEVVLTQYYDQTVDFFSLGVVIYRCICGKKPFQKKKLSTHRQDPDRARKTSLDLDRNVVEMIPPFDSSKFNPNSKSLIRGLLCKNPKERLGTRGYDEIKQHPFFDSIDFGLLEAGYLQPPFIPACDEIHAEQQQFIGRPPDDDKYTKIKLTTAFEDSLKKFPFHSNKVMQSEIVELLETVYADRRKSTEHRQLKEEMLNFPKPPHITRKHQCMECVLI